MNNIPNTFFISLEEKIGSNLGCDINMRRSEIEKEKITVYINGQGRLGMNFHLAMWLYERKSIGASPIFRPTVEIVQFYVNPKGQGIGSKVIETLINHLEDLEDGFEMLLVTAQDEQAAKFWRKVGFQVIEHTSTNMPSMTRKLSLKSKVNKISVNVAYRSGSSGDKILVDEFDIFW